MLCTAVLADIGNLYYTVGKKFNKAKLDYGKLASWLTEATADQYNIQLKVAYGVEIKDSTNLFFKSLSRQGWEINSIEPFMWRDPVSGLIKPKGVERCVSIAIDTVEMLKNGVYQNFILLTSDPVYADLCKYIKRQGATVHVIGAGVPQQLKRVANQCDEWDEGDDILL